MNLTHTDIPAAERLLIWTLCLLVLAPWTWLTPLRAATIPDAAPAPRRPASDTVIDARLLVPARLPDNTPLTAVDTIASPSGDSILNVVVDPESPYGLDGRRIFNPDPTRAVWLSALLPGLGQVYNRRYWKLPLIVAGFMGLGYGTNWNNNQFQDYSQAYRDLLDNDPDTRSYMDFFPPTTREEDLDKSWLTQTMKSRKDYYRRNRDLCVICIVGLYLLCMVDSYVDASLAHFDISPGLSMDMRPALFVEPGRTRAAVGLNWAFTF